MKKENIEELAELEDLQLARIRGEALGKLVYCWSEEKSEKLEKLREADWFHMGNLDFVITADGQFKLADGVITDIPEDTGHTLINIGSEFIRDFLEEIVKALEEPSTVIEDVDWRENSLVVVLGLGHRRG